MGLNDFEEYKADRCILHIGPPKTASTTIQRTLRRAAPQLVSSGVLYPSFAANHRFLATLCSSEPMRLRQVTKHNITRAEVAARSLEGQRLFEAKFCTTKPRLLILSSEHLVQLYQDRPGLHTLREYLLGFAKRVDVIFYVRDPLLLMISRLFHGIKRGDRRLNAPLENMPESPAPGIIESYRAVFGSDNLKLLMFPGDLPSKTDIMESFWSATGLSALGSEIETISANQSLSGAGLLIADALSDIQNDNSSRVMNGSRLQHIRGPKLRLEAASVTPLRERCAETYRYFQETWGIEFPVRDLVGPPPAQQDLFTSDSVQGIAQTFSEVVEELKVAKREVAQLRRRLNMEKSRQ